VIFLRTNIRGQVIWTGIFLAGYWLLMAFAPFPVNVHGETRWISGVLEKGDNFSAYIDNLLMNGPFIGTHVFKGGKTWDPEGIVSTLPAIATCLFGILTGHLLRNKQSDTEKTAWLMVGGAGLMWLGLLMDLALPINKSLWTSSYSVFMAGLAMICFGVYYWLIDVQGWRAWAKPFAIFGMNAIAVFVLSGVIGRIMLAAKVSTGTDTSLTLQAWLFQKLFVPLASLINASLLWAFVYVLLLYLVAWAMYRKKWFVKF
jgi:predicted acyltransferase